MLMQIKVGSRVKTVPQTARVRLRGLVVFRAVDCLASNRAC